MNKYLSKIDCLLDTHAPFKKLNKKELNFLAKPWISQGLQNSIKKENNIYSKFVKCKSKIMIELHHKNYKNYRNVLSTLLKRAKEEYFTNFFNENIKDIKKTWKGIKTLLSMKQKNNDTPSLMTKDENTLMIQSQLLILLITFLPLLLKLFIQKSNFQINHSRISCHQKSVILS